MITIIGPEGTSEYKAARRLRDLIIEGWPGVDKDVDDDIRIVAGAKCYGQETADIDLVVFVLLAKPRPIPLDTPDQEPIFVRSLCLTIELKEHEPDRVIFDGNQATVWYGKHPHSATEQSHKQQAALRDFYKQHRLKPPFVTNLIWLPNIPQRCLPEVIHNIIGDQATWGSFLGRVVVLRKPWADRVAGILEIDAFSRAHPEHIAQIVNLLTKRLEMSELDRRKVDRIARRQQKETIYWEKIGTQLLIFRGRGGTGKTVRLLQLAYDLYREQGARVLLLTYNKALVSDLQRLFALIGAGDGDAPRAITFKTVHAFLYQIVKYSDPTRANPEQFIPQFEQHKQRTIQQLQALRSAHINRQDRLNALIAAAPEHFDWDYIFIDEAQDWPKDERDLLFLLYDFRRFVLADGVDQMVRGAHHTHWRDVINKQKSQIVTLHKSLRLKAGLCTFALAVAQHLDLPNWHLEPDKDLYGGRVIIIEGSYTDDRSLHDQEIDRMRQLKNYPIDMLFCVPPSLVHQNSRKEVHAHIADHLEAWEYHVWDGTSNIVRSQYPTSLEQIRIVQYDSCRGLEAWTSVNLGLDELYDYKRQQYRPPSQAALFRDDEREAHLFAATWLMIPLTRAIDTLVIQIRSSDHYIARMLQAVAKECPDIVEWRKVTPKGPMKQ